MLDDVPWFANQLNGFNLKHPMSRSSTGDHDERPIDGNQNSGEKTSWYDNISHHRVLWYIPRWCKISSINSISPSQTMHYFFREIHQNYPTFVLFDPPENWWFNDPYFKSPEKNPTVPNTRLASFSIEKSFHVGICFHLNSLLCQNPTWWDVCKQYECYCCRNQNQYRLNKSSKGLLRSCFLSLRFWALFGTAKWCVPSPPAVENC